MIVSLPGCQENRNLSQQKENTCIGLFLVRQRSCEKSWFIIVHARLGRETGSQRKEVLIDRERGLSFLYLTSN